MLTAENPQIEEQIRFATHQVSMTASGRRKANVKLSKAVSLLKEMGELEAAAVLSARLQEAK